MRTISSLYVWLKIPVVRAIIPFLIGIVTAINVNYDPLSYIIIGVAFVLVSLALFEKFLYGFKNSWIRGVLLSLLIFSVSFIYTLSKVQITQKCHFSKYEDDSNVYIAFLTDNPVEKSKTWKCDLNLKYLYHKDTYKNVVGKLIVYLPKSDTSVCQLKSGDCILFNQKPERIKPPLNPGQFNYSRFLYYKQVYHQAFLKRDQYLIKTSSQYSLLHRIRHLRYRIVEIINKRLKVPDEAAIASALLVGYKVELSDEVRQSFVSTGAMHVLAVSGLHVGIIYLVCNYLLCFIKRWKAGRFIHLFLMLFILWFYAFLTGLSPSVFRAAVMFSFVNIGMSFRKNLNVFGSILTSLFVLLIVDPFLITQVGFQLSYVAVFGIVYLQPKIYAWIKAPFYLDWLWKLTAVSLSAQIATFPLGLYYFNQFPVYFFVSNIVVIPAATLIIYLGLPLILAELLKMDLLAHFLGYALEFTIHWLNEAIMLIRDLPYGLVDEIFLSKVSLITLYLAILSLLLFFLYKKRSLLLLTLGLCTVLMTKHVFWEYRNLSSEKVVVYAINNASLVGFYSTNQVVFYGDSNILNDYYTLKYNTFRDVWKAGIKAEDIIKVTFKDSFQNSFLKIQNRMAQFNEMKILVLNHENQKSLREKIDVDYVLLSHNPYLNKEFYKKYFGTSGIVVDLSNKWWLRKLWRKELEMIDVDPVDIGTQGAFVIAN